MHRHNRKYGHGEILARYCGVEASLPIIGEVQHSLFLSTHHFKSDGEIGPPRAFGALGAPLFSWNSLLPIRNQIAIGDPLLYSSWVCNSSDSAVETQDSDIPLVMPKLNEELSQNQRLHDYLRLADIAREVSSSKEVLLSVHPRDLDLAQSIADTRGYIRIHHAMKAPGSGYREKMAGPVARLNTKRLIVSDYFGAHVFRANAYFGSRVYVDPNKALNRAIHPSLRPLLLEFLALAPDDKNRDEISNEILGTRFLKEPEELSDIIYRPDVPFLARKLWVASYKLSRRTRVQLRNLAPSFDWNLPRYIRKKKKRSLNEQFPPFTTHQEQE